MTAYHRCVLVTHIFPGNPALLAWTRRLTPMLVWRGYSPAVAPGAGGRLLDAFVQAQAFTMAINDAFLLVLAIFAMAFPLVFLLRKSAPGAASAAVH
jgi:hypothetical protein